MAQHFAAHCSWAAAHSVFALAAEAGVARRADAVALAALVHRAVGQLPAHRALQLARRDTGPATVQAIERLLAEAEAAK